MRSKIIILIAALVFTLGTLTSCGGPSITDAKSLVAANKAAQEAVKNFHMDGDLDMEMKMKMEELQALLGTAELSMPMKMEMSMDMSKETAHGTTKTDVTTLGQTQSVDAEMYCDIKEGIVYTKTDASNTWVKSNQEINTADMVESLAGAGDELLEKAEFSSDDDSYKLTLSAEVLGESINDLGLMNDIGSAGMEIKDLNMSEGTIVYTFDKETVLMKKVEMDDVKVTANGTMDGTSLDMDIDMDAEYEFSKYDELDPKDYEIPEDVVNPNSGKTTDATKATEAQKQELPKATTQLTVSGSGTPKDQGWYVVGQDNIPAGTYKIFHGDGQGVLTIKNANQSKTMGDWTIGFNDDSKELKDGTEVTMSAGDLVFITKDLNVVFDPVN